MAYKRPDSLLSLKKLITTIINDFISEQCAKYIPAGNLSNENAAISADINKYANQRIVSQTISSVIKPMLESSREYLMEKIKVLHSELIVSPGTSLLTVHSDNLYDIVYTVKRGARRTDETKLRTALILNGVDPNLVEKCFLGAETSNNPSVVVDIFPAGESKDDKDS